MKKTRKILAVLLIAVLAASLLSTAAFADGPEAYCSGSMQEHMKYWAGVAKDLFEKGVKGFLDIIRPHAVPAPLYEAGEMAAEINMPGHMAQWAEVAARLAEWGIRTFWQLTHPFG